MILRTAGNVGSDADQRGDRLDPAVLLPLAIDLQAVRLITSSKPRLAGFWIFWTSTGQRAIHGTDCAQGDQQRADAHAGQRFFLLGATCTDVLANLLKDASGWTVLYRVGY
ncbi:hypothetical protein D3C77_282730 [compost metagenome]